MTNFTITWEIDDGYAGGSRPHHTDFSLYEFDAEMTEDEIRSTIADMISDDMANIGWHAAGLDQKVQDVMAALALQAGAKE